RRWDPFHDEQAGMQSTWLSVPVESQKVRYSVAPRDRPGGSATKARPTNGSHAPGEFLSASSVRRANNDSPPSLSSRSDSERAHTDATKYWLAATVTLRHRHARQRPRSSRRRAPPKAIPRATKRPG